VPWSPLPTPDAGDGAPPSRMGELVDRVLAGLGAPKADAIVEIHQRWEHLAGDALAGHSSPIAVEEGRLRVQVDGAAWASHLRWSEGEILERIAAAVGPSVVVGISARVTRPNGRRAPSSGTAKPL
jgi:predicted nucleic acid-binding Zn ribbon protein